MKTQADPARNLVLGCATGYSYAQILPFVATLRGTSFSGEIGLFIHDEQIDDLAELTERFAELAHSTLRTEMDLHRGYAADWGISREELERERPHTATRA